VSASTTERSEQHHVRGGGGAILTAADVARLTGGDLVGDADAPVAAVASLDRATATDLSFYTSSRYAGMFATSSAGVVLVAAEFRDVPSPARARIVVARPHEAMLAVLPSLYRPAAREPGIHPTAVIGRGVTLGDDVTIGAFVVLGDGATVRDRAWIESHCAIGARAEVGADARLHPGVTLYADTVVGRRVIVHAGARLGSDGYGYVFRDGAHEKIPHVGRCVVEDDVEIGANTTIDRGSIGDTVIGAGTKIDNLVHVGHNVRLGKLCLLMAQVGIAGSTVIEDGCIVAGQAGIGGHVTIGRGARIGGQAGVFGDVPAGETWSGYPARRHRESMRAHAALFKLAPIATRLHRLLDGPPAAARDADGGAA
jgi:UDP-3-O-[3-hydroxymyristoyl] glucosamine N-acyltransferase